MKKKIEWQHFQTETLEIRKKWNGAKWFAKWWFLSQFCCHIFPFGTVHFATICNATETPYISRNNLPFTLEKKSCLAVMQQQSDHWYDIRNEMLSVSTCHTAKKNNFICGHFNGVGSFAESSGTSSHSCFFRLSAVNTLISRHTHDFPVGNLCSWHPMQWGMKHPNYVLHCVEQCDSLKARLAHIDSLTTLWLYCVGKVVRHPRYILNAKLSTPFFFFCPISHLSQFALSWC